MALRVFPRFLGSSAPHVRSTKARLPSSARSASTATRQRSSRSLASLGLSKERVSTYWTKLAAGTTLRRTYHASKSALDTQSFTENAFEHDVSGYQTVVNNTMKELVEKCEELEGLNLPGFDAIDKDGVFELHLGPKGTYVINKQAPNRQLWWSSPLSGPKRYNYDVKLEAWRNSRDGHFMYDLLNEELTKLLGMPFDIYTVAKRPKQ